ncbi:glycosyl transferase [Sutcliffiella horikoshii]|uniref:glycosyl transferase n=1 Tax=Sutcliffiella horikoshii TaxID=79883 RepID=UPI00384E5099
MNKQAMVFFILGIVILVVSSPLGYSLVNIVYRNQNLTGEFVPLLNGFIHSLMLIGVLVFSIGVVTLLKEKN